MPAVPTIEPTASDDRSFISESGSSTTAERRPIHTLGSVRTAGSPRSLATPENMSPRMIEYARPATSVMKITVRSGITAVFSENTLVHVSRYVLLPTALPTRAISEYVYAEERPVNARIAIAGQRAAFESANAAMPAASASTPEPTMFLARLAIEPTTGAPAGSGCAPAVSAASCMYGGTTRRCCAAGAASAAWCELRLEAILRAPRAGAKALDGLSARASVGTIG